MAPRFKQALQTLLGNAPMLARKDSPPYVMCTTFDMSKEATVVFARATSAAPTYFDPMIVTTANGTPNRTFVDGGIQANCPAKLAVKFATEFQLHSRADNFVEMIASLGTGLESPSLSVPRDNGLSWAARLISFALESEKLWKDGILENAALRDVPKVRVNPPGLGSLDPFVSSSIPELREGTTEYLKSHAGKLTIGRLIHLVHAKLWRIKQLTNLVAGTASPMQIEMREHRLDFSTMSEPVLRKIIEDRRDCVSSVELKELRDEAEAAFSEQPFVPSLEGRFVVKFNGTEQELTGREFNISSAEQGTPQLQVWWRSDFGDFPISGFPRSIRVVGEQ
ncbi:hypothetical protein EMIHUDRAFT_239708 [Emiliania huxleyi CCMP1516]|uniref:PNPLA domain-containing protein n=2 Tax=Emiliania huxleyi TaxID=2903 RepID=A0A0D3JIU3_EMIH1|nr:hypothetical protein EMIHUDRAFT_239708 [Emiliania huxleyi CCMP1516]EOD23428.1 hypothetical protein EMIHUDRAFT_239708 [Emiliania huxleyi CCMP1516]|eukprot:XP_005775857.1 hypothetical protein EMIHUDRAFT_239708 [Emiliania huxleyi CCMP1516]